MRYAVIGYVVLVLAVGLLVTLVMPSHSEEEGSESHAATLPAEVSAPEEIAERVGELRGAELDTASPKVEVVPAEELEKKLDELDAKPPQDEALAKAAALVTAQAGALPAEEAEQYVNRRYHGSGTFAAYLPEENVILLDQEVAESDPAIAEAVIAGEMSRALDAAGKEAPRVAPLLQDDEAVRVGLTGGIAALVEREYAKEHLGGEADTDATFLARVEPDMPPAAETLATFPTTVGGTFATGAHEAGGWEGVAEVLGDAPETTSALLHPNPPEAVPAPEFSVQDELGKAWKRLATADVGELDTVAMLRAGNEEKVAYKAAAGWRSGRLETWMQGSPRQQCPPPCRKKSVSVVVHRWSDEADANTFTRAMRDSLTGGAQAEPEGGRGFTIEDGGAALVQAGRFTALVFAPDAPLAGRVAEKALEGG